MVTERIKYVSTWEMCCVLYVSLLSYFDDLGDNDSLDVSSGL